MFIRGHRYIGEINKMKSCVLAYLEDIKEEYLTEEAKKKLEEDRQEKEEYPFARAYDWIVVSVMSFAIIAVVTLFVF